MTTTMTAVIQRTTITITSDSCPSRITRGRF